MKCSVCEAACGWGALVVSVVGTETDTVQVCNRCRRTLLGPEVDERVRRLVRLKGWVQPALPLDFGARALRRFGR